MLSDGQNRGSMTYPSTNSLSSGSNPARAQSDRTTVPAPTQTTISQLGSNSHRLPQRIDPQQPISPMHSQSDFRAVEYSSFDTLYQPRSNNALLISQDYDKPSQRSPTYPMTTGAGQSPRHSSEFFPPVYQQAGFETPHTTLSDDHRPDRSSLHDPRGSTIRSPHLLTAPLPVTQGFQQCQDTVQGAYGYSNRTNTPGASSYSPFRPGSYPREIFREPVASPGTSCPNVASPRSQPAYPDSQSSGTYTPFSPPASLSFHSSSGGDTLGRTPCEPGVTGVLGLNVNNRSSSSSTTITTTLHMNVNVTTDQQMVMDSTRIRSSSIPMSNGTPPQAAIIPSAPGPPFFSAPHSHHCPLSTHASMSVSTQGSALELTAQVIYSPPSLPHLPSTPHGVERNQGSKQSQPLSSTQTQHIPLPGRMTEPELLVATPTVPNKKSAKTRTTHSHSSHSEPEVNPRVITSKKKKKKAKMHVCAECGKEFPRPSGLKTHENTHNNSKPFACTHQGCNRRFSVRSNAKRHLKTHMAPSATHSNVNPSNSSPTTPSTKPVDTLDKPDHPRPNFRFEPFILDGGSTSGTGVKNTGQDVEMYSASAEAVEQGVTTHTSYTGPAFYKLRWMPLTSNSEGSNAPQFMHPDDRRLHERDQEEEESS